MKIFLSYASEHDAIAAEINYELESDGHEVFFDAEELSAGLGYTQRIRAEIRASDLFVFLISPESIATGRYTLTELEVAKQKWPNPAGRVLPVMIVDTDVAVIPPYLRAVTWLEPRGSIAAEVALAVEEISTAPNDPGRIAGAVAAERSPTPGPGLVPPRAPITAYKALEVRFEDAGADGTYSLTVGDTGGTGSHTVRYSVDPEGLDALLWSSALPVEGSFRRSAPSEVSFSGSRLPTRATAEAVGRTLFESLTATDVGQTMIAHLRSIDPQARRGARLLINTTGAPALARLPWEFLYDPTDDDFLFTDHLKPVVRSLDVDLAPVSLGVDPPLTLLIASASPADRPELQIGNELANLDHSLGQLISDGLVEVETLEHATIRGLGETLLATQANLLHFIGHGDFVDGQGVLLFESEETGSASSPISGRDLGVVLRNYLASLRLVYLNSCVGAEAAPGDPFGGVAQSLIRRGVPAVIAMQFPIPDREAVSLARHFYQHVAAGAQVESALTSARGLMFGAGQGVEWAAPALYTRADDGYLLPAPLPEETVAAPAATPVNAPIDAPVSQHVDAAVVSGAARSAGLLRSVSALPLAAALAAAVIVLAVGALVFFASSDEGDVDDGAPEPSTDTSAPSTATTSIGTTSGSTGPVSTATPDPGTGSTGLSSQTSRPAATTSTATTQPPATTTTVDVDGGGSLLDPVGETIDAAESGVVLVQGVEGDTLDIRVDGDLSVVGADAGSRFGPAVAVPSGTSLVEVFLTGQDEQPVFSGAVGFGPGSTVVVHRDPDDGSITVAGFEEDLSGVRVGEGRITVRHLLDRSGPVDVVVDGETVATIEPGREATFDLAGSRTVSIELVGADGDIVGSTDVEVASGELVSLTAVGGETGFVAQAYSGLALIPDLVPTGDSGLTSAGAGPRSARTSGYPDATLLPERRSGAPRRASAPATSAPTPVGVSVAGLGIGAAVTTAGLDGGDFDVPNAETVGWYRHGARPGEAGATVLAAHVDYNEAAGAFFNLRELVPGDRVEIEMSDGSILNYLITETTEHDKIRLPVDDLFRTTGAPALYLITCGGEFDHDLRSYEANLVVTAVPIAH